MNRRTLAVAVAVTLMTLSAHAAESSRKQDAALPEVERPLSLRALFDRARGVATENANGITAGPFQVDVILARIDTDGRLVKVCVDNEEAARRFLDAPIEKVEGRRAKEH